MKRRTVKMLETAVEYTVIYSGRKTIAIEVCRDGSVVVRAPFGTKAAVIKKITEQKRDWILKTAERQKQRKQSCFEELSSEQLMHKKEQTRNIVLPLVEYYSGVMGVEPSHISITSAKTRFGSCSGKNALSFSYILCDYPMTAAEYVIVHELAHIKQHNHSKAFWLEVEKILPDYKQRQKLLKE